MFGFVLIFNPMRANEEATRSRIEINAMNNVGISFRLKLFFKIFQSSFKFGLNK